MVDDWDLVEADFLRFYGLDLRVEESRMSTRRIAALIRTLPSDSAVGRMHGQESRSEEASGDGPTVIRSGEAFAGWMNSKAKKA